LVGETVQRTSKSVQRGCERQIWIGERRADEFARVRRDVTPFVVTATI
jgi:hypothetical protein